jgi:hypothetical protein
MNTDRIFDELVARKITVVDLADRPRIEMEVARDGTATIMVRHPLDDDTFIAIEAGSEVAMANEDAPWCSIFLNQGTDGPSYLLGPTGEVMPPCEPGLED